MRFGTVNIGFTYDVDGLRTSKTVHNVDLEHKYYYVGNRLQYETIGDSSALWYFYDADGNPSGIRYKDHNGTVNDYYFVCNWRGDVIQIYNASGVLVATYDYDAWGRVSENATDKDTQNIAEINPIRYRGYYYDSETGLYYLKSRYYDPAVKRFLNVDGLVSTSVEDAAKNMFAYCTNNPVFYADSEGNCRYEANSYDFYRMNHGLPAAKCICNKKKEPEPSDDSDVIRFYTDNFVGPALKEIATSYADEFFELLILPKNIMSPLMSSIWEPMISGVRRGGVVSLVLTATDIAWDYYIYSKTDINKFYISATITLAGVAATAIIGTVVVPALGLTGVGAVVATVIGGVVVSAVENKAKKHWGIN